MRRKISFVILLISCLLLVSQFACRALPSGQEGVAAATATVTASPKPTKTATATPVPTRWPERLEVTLDDTHPLDRFPPDTPLVLRFNQPMNRDLDSPLSFSPRVDGRASWDETGTTLTFVPEDGFPASRSYRITLNPSLHSQNGVAFSTPQEWHMRTQSRPQVSRRIPSSYTIADRQPTIRLTFSRPMDRRSVGAAFRIEPALVYETAWEGEVLIIRLEEPLAFDTGYQFSVAKTAVDESGIRMARDYQWNYQLRGTLARMEGPTIDNPQAPIALHFNYPVDPATFDAALRIDPPLGGSWDWGRGDTVATLVPDGRLPASAEYTISFAGPLRDGNGNELPLPDPIDLTTPPPILSHTPGGQSVHPATDIEIRFDRPMDESAAEAAFAIKPEVAGEFSWQETTLRFRPQEGYLTEFRTYVVTLSTEAADKDGQAILAEPFTWSFRTGKLEDVADFGYGPNAQVLDANGRRAVQFQAYLQQPVRLDFELYSLTLAQFLDRYASGFRGWAGWGEEAPPAISIEDTELVKRWQVETTRSQREWGNAQEVIIPQDVPPGLYILNLTAGGVNDQLILLLTQNTLTVKQAEGQLVVWVTDINGEPVPGVEVGVYARNGDRLSAGQANESGVFQTEIVPYEEGGPASLEPLIVIAGDGNDITASGLSPEWRSNGGWGEWWQLPQRAPEYAAYIYTDRPIYKPGQDVFFKAILRQDEDAVLSLAPAGTAVTVRLRDARDNVVQTIELTTNDFGSVNGSFSLAEGAMLGRYHIELVAGEESHRQAFKVEDYRKPDYQVTVTTDGEGYVQGDTIAVTVESTYFFGQPVADAEVTIRRFDLSPNWYGGPEEYTWFENYATMERPITGRTDSNGRFTTTISVNADDGFYNQSDDWNSTLSRATWGIEATVDDGSHQTVSGFATADIFNAVEAIQLDTHGYVHEPGQPFTIEAQVSTIFDEPISGRALSLELRCWNSNTYDYTTVMQTAELTTDESGRANLAFTIEEPGYYQIVVSGKDGGGRNIGYTSWVFAFSDFYSDWYGRSSSALMVDADRTSYAPGDTARLLIESSFSGPALLTFERGTVRRQRLIELTAPVTMVEVPVEATDIPNIYVAVNAWQEQDTALTEDTWNSLPDSRLHTASVNLSVPATTKVLNVTITPDQEVYAPREEATFTVRVTNHAGQPVSAEVLLAMVDEAIFALSGELSGAIYDAFYFERAGIVETYNALNPIRYLGGGGMGGGGDGGPPEGGPRRDFPDTAAWFPTLTTDFNGEATVTVTLPDSLTSWRLTAKAATADTQIGEATANVVTQKDIIVRPLLPRVLTVGDTVALSAIVHNYSDEGQEVAVTLAEVDQQQLRVQDELTQTIAVAAGGLRLVGWTVTATTAGETEIVVTARPTAGRTAGDAVQLTLPIQPLAIPDVSTQVGQFSGRLQTSLTMPARALEMSSVEIQLSRSIAGSLLEGLEYLTGFPYGCVEQTMSKALPNAVVGRALNQLGVSNPTLQADLPAQINASLQRLYGYQHNDGGWGWWYDDPSHDYQTAWVIFGLATIADAGYEVDAGVIERGVEWLNTNLNDMDARTRAFALYSMAMAGQPNRAATLALVDELEELDTFSQTGLALALHQLGQAEAARSVVDLLAETAVVGDGTVHWAGADHDGHYYQKTMASDTRNTALALSAFSNIRPGHELEGGIVRWLMTQRRSNGWGTTNETSFAILGLTDHLLATSFSEEATSTGYTVRLNGEVVGSGSLGRGEPAVSLSIPRQQLQAGGNDLVVEQSGSGQLYYVVSSRAYLPQRRIDAAGDVAVTRTYLDAETNEPVETIAPGQLVRVRITVRLPQDGNYMMVEDHLPGGLEALNEGLNTTSHVASAYGEPESYWPSYGYNYKEVRGDRVTFFITEMEEGQQTFTYYARATHNGRFTAMPVEVSAMYNLSLWGRSASNGIVITADQ